MLSIGLIINVFVALALLGLLWWGGNRIMAASGIGEPIVSYFTVFCVVVGVLYILALLTGSAPVLYRG